MVELNKTAIDELFARAKKNEISIDELQTGVNNIVEKYVDAVENEMNDIYANLQESDY